MKKRKLLFVIIILLISSFTISFKLKNKYIKKDDSADLAILINGIESSSIPPVDNYNVSVYCLNATGIWDYDNWKAVINNIAGTVKCTLSFKSTTKENLANKIIGLSGKTQGTGEVVNENGYRYEGFDPNNYISFNGELWRIIGVFDSSSHGIADTNLVKIVKNQSIGDLTWDKANVNDWPNSSLYHLLNEYYYNGTNESTLTYCYGFSTTISSNCDFTLNGITNGNYRNLIQNVSWYLGGIAASTNTTDSFYTAERGTTVYTGRSTTATGNIGLMYASDYGYAALASSCTRTTNLGSYGTSACAGQNWLFIQGYELTIDPYPSNAVNAWAITSTGYAFNMYSLNGRDVLPTLYLKSDVATYAGDGSINNPYIITE